MLIINEDVKLEEITAHPANHNVFYGIATVHINNIRDMLKSMGINIHTISMGTKSCLAQMGQFGKIRHSDDNLEQKLIEIKQDEIKVNIKFENYSGYPISFTKGQEIGRFYATPNNHLSQSELNSLLKKQKKAKKPIYAGKNIVKTNGFMALHARHFLYEIDSETKQTPPYLITSRSQLPKLQKQVKVAANYEINRDKFLVTDTPNLYIPAGYAGLLGSDYMHGDDMPVHLNSPIIDPLYDGNLRLELHHNRVDAVQLNKLISWMRIYRVIIADNKGLHNSYNQIQNTKKIPSTTI